MEFVLKSATNGTETEEKLNMSKLSSGQDLLDYFEEHGATGASLMDFIEEHPNDYEEELYWRYPISDGSNYGLILVLVKEGILCLPYDRVEKADYEHLILSDGRLLHDSEELQIMLDDFRTFAEDVEHGLESMAAYLRKEEQAAVDKTAV